MTYIIFLVIFIISLLTLLPSFNLALFGDDWLAFFRYAQHLGPKSSGEWNHLTYFLTPYGAQDILMGLMQKIFGFESTWYYFASFILRMIAAFSFYPLVFYLIKSRLATFFSILFFSVTTTGFDATNWVFNMPVFVTITLFNLCLYFFLKARENTKQILLIISGIFYYFAYITTPIRMHGSILFIFLLEIFWIIQNTNLKILKKSIIRFGYFLAIFLIIRYTGHSQGPPQEINERFNLGINTMSMLLQEGRFDFIFYPIVMFGNMIIPDFLLPPGFNIRYILLLLTGGCVFITTIFFITKFFKQTNISTALFLSLTWSFLSFFFAWWWVPQTLFPTTYRYLIVSAAGISILLATVISIGKDRTQQRLLFTFLSFIMILHIISTRIYINFLINSHGQEISNKIWASIPKVGEIGKSREPIIFYFEGDGTNELILHDTLTFGFPPRMALLYKLREEDGGFPIPMSNWQEVVSAITDGKILASYGHPVKPISTERIYAFFLSGKDKLINITDIARQKLLQIKSQSNSDPVNNTR